MRRSPQVQWSSAGGHEGVTCCDGHLHAPTAYQSD
eukprot:CAMPEP_0174381314 /NCGR_PEP_ID=MMETSP0811_2-20130205/123930_1 /TAXON_ID=73025 ORGANISM="Eutreptiella gymnastica-like, Strain CCMP1594" /NCGR_SAMPLE_ID=MMETSP0811_2 /ASSEMBLY_ACC=CAM_ASM_000667 /LENGTH=34 /DNA_ID= /DNA_START= /DNA_END= /DNA_ORIENTATION=